MFNAEEAVRNAVIVCLVQHPKSSIHTIRRYVMENVSVAKIEDINAAVVDLISEGDIQGVDCFFSLRLHRY